MIWFYYTKHMSLPSRIAFYGTVNRDIKVTGVLDHPVVVGLVCLFVRVFPVNRFLSAATGRVASFLVDFTYNQKDLRVISVYVPTDGSERIAFLQTLDRYVVTRGQIIFGGDFNCLLDLARDKQGGNASFVL